MVTQADFVDSGFEILGYVEEHDGIIDTIYAHRTPMGSIDIFIRKSLLDREKWYIYCELDRIVEEAVDDNIEAINEVLGRTLCDCRLHKSVEITNKLW